MTKTEKLIRGAEQSQVFQVLFYFFCGREGEGGGGGAVQGSGRAMVLGNFQCRFVRLTWIIVRLGPTVLAVGVGVCCLDFFSRL